MCKKCLILFCCPRLSTNTIRQHLEPRRSGIGNQKQTCSYSRSRSLRNELGMMHSREAYPFPFHTKKANTPPFYSDYIAGLKKQHLFVINLKLCCDNTSNQISLWLKLYLPNGRINVGSSAYVPDSVISTAKKVEWWDLAITTKKYRAVKFLFALHRTKGSLTQSISKADIEINNSVYCMRLLWYIEIHFGSRNRKILCVEPKSPQEKWETGKR